MVSKQTANFSVESQNSPNEDDIDSSPSEKLEAPGQFIFAIIAAAVGSAFQHGYNTGIVNAPQSVIEKFITETYYEKYKEMPATSMVTLIFSIMVSIFCLGGMAGGLGTAYLAKAFGRKGGLILNNILVFIAAALMGFGKTAKSYEMMIVGRFIIGVNAGLNAGLAPMYLTEISPVHLRGAIGTIYQLNITISILLSQILGMPEILGTDKGWPYLFGLIIIPSIFMLVTLNSCPESPKYLLINKGQDDASENALKWLRGTSEVQNEMNEMRTEYEEAKLVPKVKLSEMCSNAMYRKPLIISVVIMLSQQWSGVNAVSYFLLETFKKIALR
ncbi:solute carrier family 2, facilitated glucose transporter member 1-like [Stegodyphus dumicola]|uniref:solute carrier family 2, facilitated glucose transporter member 1-like n=1 Tax=Stegodyphus dumicola TaxID=202533 RepID=UPI0015A80283|nr:solute carrier family 2, facilitated glucose transporter member 1-like [Stegodyphus dumicola]